MTFVDNSKQVFATLLSYASLLALMGVTREFSRRGTISRPIFVFFCARLRRNKKVCKFLAKKLGCILCTQKCGKNRWRLAQFVERCSGYSCRISDKPGFDSWPVLAPLWLREFRQPKIRIQENNETIKKNRKWEYITYYVSMKSKDSNFILFGHLLKFQQAENG